MTFTQALEQNKPMRREAWLKHPPQKSENADVMRALVDSSWVYCRLLVENAGESRWIWLSSGKAMSLNRGDYLAIDWSVL